MYFFSCCTSLELLNLSSLDMFSGDMSSCDMGGVCVSCTVAQRMCWVCPDSAVVVGSNAHTFLR